MMSSTCAPCIDHLLQAIEAIEGPKKGTKKARICSYCNGTDGHNATTCEVKWQLFGLLMDEVQKPARLCGYCACDGHDKRNCHLHHIAINFFEKTDDPIPRRVTFSEDPVVRQLTFETPLLTPLTTPVSFGSLRRTLFTTPETTGRRTITHKTSHGIQVVDYDVVDEPWVWAPVRSPLVFP